MKILDITPDKLKNADLQELLSLHLRTHQLWPTISQDGKNLNAEDLVNAHAFIVQELERRGKKHKVHDELDKQTAKLGEAVPSLDFIRNRLTKAEDVVIGENFVCLVGSIVKGKEAPGDVDLLIRYDRRWGDVETQLRKVFDPEKEGYLHWPPIYNERGPHDDYVPLFDLVLRPKRKWEVRAVEAELEPWGKFKPMKPAMMGTTEYFSTEELWPWVKEKLEKGYKVFGEVKYDGFRCVLWKRGNRTGAWFEDAQEDRSKQVPQLIEGIKKLDKDVILDGELVAEQNGKPIPRTQLFSVLIRKLDAEPVLHVFDCLYYGEDLRSKQLSGRKAILKGIVEKLPETNFRFTQHKAITDKDSLEEVGKWAASQPYSEGLMVKIDGPYKFGGSDDWAKWKTVFEIKVAVLDVEKKENGYTYRCGLREPGEFINTVEVEGEKYVDLGNTFVTTEKVAGIGDTLNVRIEELIIQDKGGKKTLTWGKPTVVGPDKSRDAYTASQAVDLAKRGHVLKEEIAATEGSDILAAYEHKLKELGYDPDNAPHLRRLRAGQHGELYRINDGWGEWYFLRLPSGKIQRIAQKMPDVGAFHVEPPLDQTINKDWVREHGFGDATWDQALLTWLDEGREREAETPPDEGETRGERAEKFWEENWYKLYPKSGKGRFVVHEHWRGLSEDEVKLPREELIKRGHSLHSDLRLESDGVLHGWTVFLGKAEDNETNRLISLSSNDNLQVAPKQAQPTGWLSFKGIAEPGGVGATTGKYARFDIIDSGTYEIGVWREHAMEYFFHGKKLKGRLLVQYAPLGGRRVWLIDKPEDQTPYAEKHDKEEVINELRRKGQKHLVWAKPGEKPELIDVEGGGSEG